MNVPDALERLATAIMYEGYLLYPYRPSAIKNQYRWNFGVLYPQAYAESCCERSVFKTSFLLDSETDAAVHVRVRYLHLVNQQPVDGECAIGPVPLSEIVAEEIKAGVPLQDMDVTVFLRAEPVRTGVTRLSARLENKAVFEGSDRDEALARSIIATHIIVMTDHGRFCSLIDPPEGLKDASSACENDGLWPVLADHTHKSVLAAPVILSDFPVIAPESPIDLYDGTEIDELLSLRIRTLADEEKREIRRSDHRGRELLQRAEDMTPDALLNLHGAMRSPSNESIAPGVQVRIRPKRRADAYDIVLSGMRATVLSVEYDIDGSSYVCVTVDDDPGKDLGAEGKPGHRFFFGLDEVELVS